MTVHREIANWSSIRQLSMIAIDCLQQKDQTNPSNDSNLASIRSIDCHSTIHQNKNILTTYNSSNKK